MGGRRDEGMSPEQAPRGRRALCESCSRVRGPVPPTLGYVPPDDRGGFPGWLIAAHGWPDATGDGEIDARTINAVSLKELREDGSRADGPPLIIGKPQGRPIVIAPRASKGLMITDTVETALFVHEATGLGAWAAGCAGLLHVVSDKVPLDVENVFIIVDCADPAGVNGAHELAARLGNERPDLTISKHGRDVQ